MTITWDFFLTVIISTSQRALVLSGIGPVLASAVIGSWAISIIVLYLLLFTLIGAKGVTVEKYTKIAYFFLVVIVLVYAALFVLAIYHGVVFAVIMSEAVNMLWGLALIYFRYHNIKLERLEND